MIRGGLMNPIRVGLHKTTPALISDHLLRRVKVLSTDELHHCLQIMLRIPNDLIEWSHTKRFVVAWSKLHWFLQSIFWPFYSFFAKAFSKPEMKCEQSISGSVKIEPAVQKRFTFNFEPAVQWAVQINLRTGGLACGSSAVHRKSKFPNLSSEWT